MSKTYALICDNIRDSWKSTVRAMNVADNNSLNDTYSDLKEIVVHLSKCL